MATWACSHLSLQICGQIVQLLIVADIIGPTPTEIADRLLTHVDKMASELRKGVYTRNITKCIRFLVLALQYCRGRNIEGV